MAIQPNPSADEQGDGSIDGAEALPILREAVDFGRQRSGTAQQFPHPTTGMREMLDRRYDEMASGAVESIDGPTFFEQLRRREESMIPGRN